MPLVSMKEMLVKANKEKYAVGQFNINNLEWTLAILDEVRHFKHRLLSELVKEPLVIWADLMLLSTWSKV